MHTAVCGYRPCTRTAWVANKGKALVDPKGHYINTVCEVNGIKGMKDWRSHRTRAAAVTQPASKGYCFPPEE